MWSSPIDLELGQTEIGSDDVTSTRDPSSMLDTSRHRDVHKLNLQHGEFVRRSVGYETIINIVDNDETTYGGAQVISLDLGSTHDLYGFDMLFRVCKCWLKGALKIYVGPKWPPTQLYESPDKLYAWGNKVRRTFNRYTVGIRYISFKVTKVSPVQYLGLWELKVYARKKDDIQELQVEKNSYGWTATHISGRLHDHISNTEILHLTGYKGSLFAATGRWMAQGDYIPAQVIRKDCPACNWTPDPIPNRYGGRIEHLTRIVWERDENGNVLPEPIEVLYAGWYHSWQNSGIIKLCARDLKAWAWHCAGAFSQMPYKDNYFSARFVAKHRDSVTGKELLLVSTGRPGILVCEFTSSNAAFLKCPNTTETGPLETRPLSVVVMHGVAYSAASSYILKRNDGPQPSWSKVFDMLDHQPGVRVTEDVGGIRGLSVITNTDVPGKQSMMFAWCPNSNSEACMIRLDPEGEGFRPEEETCVRDELIKYLGNTSKGQPAGVSFSIAAYNNILEIDSEEGQVQLIGFESLLYGDSVHEHSGSFHQHKVLTNAQHPRGLSIAYWSSAGYLIRRSKTSYEVREVGGPHYNIRGVTLTRSQPWLYNGVSTRCYSESPFENDDAIYFGGYDCNHFPSRNTAWIFRATRAAAFSKPVPQLPRYGYGAEAGKSYVREDFRPNTCDICPGGWLNEPANRQVAFMADHGKIPVSCQELDDWAQQASPQEAARHPICKGDIAAGVGVSARCCTGCNLCESGEFKSDNVAGYNAQHKVHYKCSDAMRWLLRQDYTIQYRTQSLSTSCLTARKWWANKCCGEK
eukprot:TRINITY_DN21585_c0_g1_i1.p1 TRINITY_DN21585_c0_g1~~TRINITY_DN21585_c0_g1_i1.p1  ORF type:complete len:908 (+),score=33.63 TRINITY_DN21585_c0_g1_i1:314-2725(+)